MLRLAVFAVVVGVAAAQTCACDKPGEASSTLDLLKKALAEKGGLMSKWGEVRRRPRSEVPCWAAQGRPGPPRRQRGSGSDAHDTAARSIKQTI